MLWTEALITTKPESVELISAMLIDAGITGFQIEDDGETKRFLEENSESWDFVDDELLKPARNEAYIKMYISRDESGFAQLCAVEDALGRIKEFLPETAYSDLRFGIKTVEDSGWLDNWKKYYKPFKIGERVIVRPVWEEYEANDGELVFTINPGYLFGTGQHQTTRMCVEALEHRVTQGIKLADLGCGSGILAIVGLMLGAKSAFACDIESAAEDVACENAMLNGIDKSRLTVRMLNLLADENARAELCDESFDLITANIVADVIMPLSPIARDMLKAGGLFICSGIIRGRLDEVKARLVDEGFAIKEINEADDWFCIIAEK